MCTALLELVAADVVIATLIFVVALLVVVT